MYQLNITIAQENVLWGLWREGVVPTLVKESDGELLNAIRTAMVEVIGETGDIENTEFPVARNPLPVIDPRRDGCRNDPPSVGSTVESRNDPPSVGSPWDVCDVERRGGR